LIVPSGEGSGAKFELRPFQKRFIREIYQPRTNGKRSVRRAILSVARKNGKTALIAGLVLVHLIGPEAVPNGEIYSAANDRDQASIVFKFARQIIEADPELKELVKVIPSTKTLLGLRTGSVYRAISAEAGTKHGYSPSLIIFDELAQAKSRDLYDVLDTSMGGRAEPLFVVISTQSNDPEHILSKLIDDGLSKQDPTIVTHLYAVDEDCENIFDPHVWKDANPALGDFRSLEDFKAVARKAQRMPAEEAKFRNLYLNQRVSPTTSLISRAEWMACGGVADFTDRERVYLGLDLSSVNDLTALIMISADGQSKVRAFFWKPEEFLAEHSHRDFGAGSRRYEEWVKAGHLLASPGKTIDKAVVATRIAELCGKFTVLGMAYDRWRIEDLVKEFDRIGFAAFKDGDKGDGLRLVPWGQGFRDMSPAVDAFEQSVMERKLVHPGNPVLTWNVGNAIVAKPDPAGNRKIDKAKVRFRVDGAVALAMALGLKSRDSAKEDIAAQLRHAILERGGFA
jgi:phage terminase large subunit-like protein